MDCGAAISEALSSTRLKLIYGDFSQNNSNFSERFKFVILIDTKETVTSASRPNLHTYDPNWLQIMPGVVVVILYP